MKTKKKEIKIGREKIDGKYFITRREGKKLIEKVPFGKGKNKLQKDTAFKNFKSRGTIKKGNISVERLTNYERVTDFTRGTKQPRFKKTQFVVEGTLRKSGKKIVSTSAIINADDVRAGNKQEAIQNAEDGFWARVHQHFTKGYDPLKGKELSHHIKSIKRGWVYYRGI